MEGLDGVGREVARRCLTWWAAIRPRGSDAGPVCAKAAREASAELDRELIDLGRRACATLEIAARPPRDRRRWSGA